MSHYRHTADFVTLSGEKDAILEACNILTEESRLERILQVDKAYHAHHTRPAPSPTFMP